VVENGTAGAKLRDQEIKEQHKLIQNLKDKQESPSGKNGECWGLKFEALSMELRHVWS
jgi:hypothetical protein